MSQQLEYQEHFNQLAHESIINTMVISPDGCRLIMGSDDSTVLVWSSQSRVTLCCFKTHSPVLSLAWVESSKGFIFGCKNGTLASVNITECHVKTTFFKGHSAAVCCISPNFNKTFPILAAKDDVKIWSRQGQTDLQVESWELKVKLPPPRTIDFRQEVEVTSVNWENQNAAAIASFAVVSYKWHGIMCWDMMNMMVLWQLPMKDCGTLSLSPNGRFVATFGLSNFFEVQDLKSDTVQSLQPLTTRPKLSKNQPVCFIHEGFAVAAPHEQPSTHCLVDFVGEFATPLRSGVGSNMATPQHLQIPLEILTPLFLQFFLSDTAPDEQPGNV
ncbi:WD40-repeat-containing domain protein [Lactarius sanguifluus]|nr:WD40-repeat-containing domain protein [Lactarius sanguifluus]